MIVRIFALCLSFLTLWACEIPAENPKFDDIRFTGKDAFRLTVGKIEIVRRYRAPAAAPNVDHRFPITPQQVLINWANDRLLAVGTTGTATFVIEDASVVETKLKKKTGLKAFFTSQQSERYDGRLAVTLIIQKGNSRAQIKAETLRSQTAAEHISVNDRDRIFYQLTHDLAVAIDQEVEAKIQQYLAEFVDNPR